MSVAVAHQGTAVSRYVLQQAAKEAAARGSSLQIVHVVDVIDQDSAEANRAGVSDSVEQALTDDGLDSLDWDLHLVTSLFFDIGVYLVVVGLVLDILRSLGAEIDRRAETGEDPVSIDAAGGETDSDRDVPSQVQAGAKPASWGGGVP